MFDIALIGSGPICRSHAKSVAGDCGLRLKCAIDRFVVVAEAAVASAGKRVSL